MVHTSASVVCLVLLGVALACAASPPAISDTFYAKVSVTLREGPDFWQGGGLYAFDTPQGKARTDVRLDGRDGLISFHVLDRYDLNATFIIQEHDKCTKSAVKGTLESPWLWLKQASYNGTSSFGGHTLDVWVYSDKQNTLTVSVRQGTTIPVFFSSRHFNGTTVSEWQHLFLEFNPKTPESWVFYVPESCGRKEGLEKGVGDVNGVVYFANSQWDCANPACSARVANGAYQPGYACAEFTARSLAYGGYIPGLTSSASQGTYSAYTFRGGRYNLLYTEGLADALGAIGFRKAAATASSCVAGAAIFGNGGDGYFSHACIGVGSQVVDCHNIAREDHPVTGSFFDGINAVYQLP